MNDIIIEDLSGNEVFRGNQFGFDPQSNVAEDADYSFDCILEEEGWIADELCSHVGADYLDIDPADSQNKNMSAVIKVFTNNVHTHNVRLVPSTGQTHSSGQAATNQATAVNQVFTSKPSLPTGNPETFIGEYEEMDLSELHGQMFGVAVGVGPRDGIKFACGTLLAPLDFYEMVEIVAACYQTNQQHAKAFILNKDVNKRAKYLDECTIDFIEARSMDIITDGLLSGALSEKTEYTCRAGFFEEPVKENKDEET